VDAEAQPVTDSDQPLLGVVAPPPNSAPAGDAPSPATLLTAAEHRVMELTVDLHQRLCRIAGDGDGRYGDLAEVVHHIHALQRIVLAQAAARAYPHRYRLLGGDSPGVAGADLRPIEETRSL
jgi:hypothetical protein